MTSPRPSEAAGAVACPGDLATGCPAPPEPAAAPGRHTEPAGLRRAATLVWRRGRAERQSDWLAEEVPVALVVNGLAHTVMLASPADLEDFALGFGVTEGLMSGLQELRDLEIHPVEQGIEVHLAVSPACFDRFKTRRRTLAGRTGCGLCGTEQLDQVRRPLATVPVVRVGTVAVARALRHLRDHQAVQQLTGACHAAAWCSADGQIVLVREDIGRHNALDKLIGARLRERRSFGDGFALITSRASFEMVQKAATAGIGLMAAVSAPTALAVDTAKACDLALAGFVRGDDLVVYHGAERFGLAATAPKPAPTSIEDSPRSRTDPAWTPTR